MTRPVDGVVPLDVEPQGAELLTALAPEPAEVVPLGPRYGAAKRTEMQFNLARIPVDAAGLLAAFALAWIVRVHVQGSPLSRPFALVDCLALAAALLPFLLLIFALGRLYSISPLSRRMHELWHVFLALSGGLLFLIVIDFASSAPAFHSKLIPVYAYGISLLTVGSGRLAIRRVQRSMLDSGVGLRRIVLVGRDATAGDLGRRLCAGEIAGYEVVGIVDPGARDGDERGRVPVAASLPRLLRRLGGVGFDQILQLDPVIAAEETLELVRFANAHQLTYRFIPTQMGLVASLSEVTILGGVPVVELKRTPLDGWGSVAKRAFDVAGSVAGLALLAPLFALIAILIKATDPGPVFYRHERISRTGGRIRLLKFRTMKTEFSTGSAYSGLTDAEVFRRMGRPDLIEEFARTQKLEKDPRVSRIGAFLRRTSLDELPQLVNALAGDISLVGPRPIVDAELPKYGEDQVKLLALRPGLTGLWQCSGRSDLGYDERVKLDIFYVENWSPLLDLKILVRTLRVVLARQGAY